MKFNILLLFLFTTAFGFAQHPEKSKADSLRDAGNLKQAIEAYAKVFKEAPGNRANTYNYACALALDKQIDTAFYYLKVAVAEDSTVKALNDPDFYFLIDDKRWKAIENALIERVEAKFGKYSDIELSKELWKMKIKDQAFYYHIELAQKQTGNYSPVVFALWELKHKINRENVIRIEAIIDERGWPEMSVIGGNAAGTVFLVIQHADLEVQKKYLPLMKEAANKGEAKWSSLALLIDRVNLKEGKKQIYGSQIAQRKDGSCYVRDLEAPEYVNQRRKQVGLGPIEDYVKLWGMEWTVEQKEK